MNTKAAGSGETMVLPQGDLKLLGEATPRNACLPQPCRHG